MNDSMRITSRLEFLKEEHWLRIFRYAPQLALLSPAQSAIAQLVACGLSDKEIAYLLGIAYSTVKIHIGSILKTMRLYRRAQLVRYIIESGQFDPEATQEILLQRWVSVSKSKSKKRIQN